MLAKGTGNLGDMMQAVALSRLVGPAESYFRDFPHLRTPEGGISVAAGFMVGPNDEPPENTLFAGIYWLPTPENVKWLRRSPYAIGARDPETYRGLIDHDIPCELIGCATLTLPKWTGPRTGEISVDYNGPGIRMTHNIEKDSTFKKEWNLCISILNQYRISKVVYTTRVHVALPCVALGTPVVYLGPTDEGRTTILGEIGIVPGRISCPDVSKWRERYKNFLYKYTQIRYNSEEPVKPTVKVGA